MGDPVSKREWLRIIDEIELTAATARDKADNYYAAMREIDRLEYLLIRVRAPLLPETRDV